MRRADPLAHRTAPPPIFTGPARRGNRAPGRFRRALLEPSPVPRGHGRAALWALEGPRPDGGAVQRRGAPLGARVRLRPLPAPPPERDLARPRPRAAHRD